MVYNIAIKSEGAVIMAHFIYSAFCDESGESSIGGQMSACKRSGITHMELRGFGKSLNINNLSVELISTKNTDALNEGRKALYKAVIYFEEIVTNFVDAPYSDYEKNVAEIENTPLDKRYFTIRKLGLAIRLIMDAYGENTKWKWGFIELQGRFATVAKNMLNMKTAMKDYFDPRSPDYDITVYYIRLIKKLLSKSADGYRDKYELSTRRIDDMRLAINYLMALRRICILTTEQAEAEELKKKIVVWKEKLEKDQKKGICK